MEMFGSFLDRKPTAVAKEELLLTAEVENLFKRSWSTEVKLYQGDEILHTVSVDLKSGEKRKSTFHPSCLVLLDLSATD